MTGEAPETFYAATAVPHPPRPRLMQEIDTGVCIVGGGFAGLWTARALARRGHEVVVLEARRIASEASGRNGGVVSAGYAERLPRIIERVGLDRARELYALSRAGSEIVRDALAEGLPGVAPVPGRLSVLRYDDEAGLRREADLLGEQFGHEVVVWPTERVREALRTERYYQALHDADAFAIHPLNLALALAAEIERLGGRIFEQTVVTGADLDGVRKRVVASPGSVRAQQVVFCGSAFIGEAFPKLARAVLPVSTYMCATEPIADRLKESIRYAGGISDTRRAGDYYRVVGDRLLWGGRISVRTKPPWRLKRRLARDIARVYPQLKGVGIEYAWSGIMGYAIHKMPQIGLLRPGVWIASAFGGHGLNTTAIAGELIAGAIAEHDDRWRLFIPFGLVWAGGAWGRGATQLVYWCMRIRDRLDEAGARRKERRAKRRAAAEAASGLSPQQAAEQAEEPIEEPAATARTRPLAELAEPRAGATAQVAQRTAGTSGPDEVEDVRPSVSEPETIDAAAAEPERIDAPAPDAVLLGGEDHKRIGKPAKKAARKTKKQAKGD